MRAEEGDESLQDYADKAEDTKKTVEEATDRPNLSSEDVSPSAKR
ncbi:hypothetical protein [Mycobacterium sp. MYCO198283]|nr:hypothetical protein [Mycobacterium sp. MYCO198283]